LITIVLNVETEIGAIDAEVSHGAGRLQRMIQDAISASLKGCRFPTIPPNLGVFNAPAAVLDSKTSGVKFMNSSIRKYH
jgi:hypothetical protein